MKHYKKLAAVAVLTLSLAVFSYYFHQHPGTLDQLKHLSPLIIVVLLLLYGVTLVSLVVILSVSLKLCGKALPPKENLLLTIYSTIVNFFGPLQSGPGVRAIYLKRKLSLNIKKFLFVSLIYYCFFAFISAGFLLVWSRPWWQSLLLLALATIVIVGGYRILQRRLKTTETMNLKPGLLIQLFAATLFQLLVIAVIYFIELHVVNHNISFGQALAYSGAANFALFVSLTPGAIGFRESFLLFSERLHHISTANVLAASVIDRAIYLVFLGLLFMLALSLHAKDRLQFKKVANKPLE